MKLAYLVLAHDNPSHLGRLTRALSSDDTAVFVHLDKKSDISPFAAAMGDKVHFVANRISAYWGDFSLVEATLVLLRAALSAPQRFDYFVLLSGTHYPLRSPGNIRAFFGSVAGHEFMDAAPMGLPSGHCLSRLSIYRARPSDPSAVRVFVALARALKIPLKRDHVSALGTLTPYSGSQWWALSRAACEHIETFTAREPGVVEFFKHSRCPDEMFFQTILANSAFKPNLRPSVTYTDWSRRGSSPADISEWHIDRIASGAPLTLRDESASNAIFARKFSDHRPDITDRIDQIIQEQGLTPAACGVE